eukprot:scaffold251577_cov17-Tisochrysis_lutea.AAC.1
MASRYCHRRFMISDPFTAVIQTLIYSWLLCKPYCAISADVRSQQPCSFPMLRVQWRELQGFCLPA